MPSSSSSSSLSLPFLLLFLLFLLFFLADLTLLGEPDFGLDLGDFDFLGLGIKIPSVPST